MSQREIQRTYRHTDADFIQLSDSIQDSLTRDLPELTSYGITIDTINDLKATRDAFSDTPVDELLSGMMMMATRDKDVKREEILQHIRQIGNRARIHFGEDSAIFRRFGMSMLSRNNDLELYRTARIVALVATEYLTPLAPTGLTAGMITELETATIEYNNLLDLKQLAVSNRDLAVENRIELGNELHEKLKKLAAQGKLCWEYTNEALYNDYILYKDRKKVSVTAGNVPHNNRVNVSVTGLRRNSTLHIKNTGTVGLEVFFAQDPTAATGLIKTIIPPNNTSTLTAQEFGYNSPKGIKHLIINNISSEKGSYHVEWGNKG